MGHYRAVLQFAAKYLRPYWGRFLAGILCGLLCGAANAGFVLVTQAVVERLGGKATPTRTTMEDSPTSWLHGAKSRLQNAVAEWFPEPGTPLAAHALLGCLLFIPLLAGARGLADYLTAYCMGWVGERVVSDLRVDIFARLNGLSLDYFTRSTTGDLVARITADTNAVNRLIRLGAADLVRDGCTALVMFTVMLWIDWRLTLVGLVFLPLTLAPLIALGRKARRASHGSRSASVSQNNLLVELLAGIRVIKAFGLEAATLARFRDFSRDQVRHGMKSVQAREAATPILELVGGLGLGVLLLYLFRAGRGAGDLVGLVTAMAFFFVAVKKIVATQLVFSQAHASVERLQDVFAQTPTVPPATAPKPFKRFEKEIRLDQVGFGYSAERPVLRDINLVIPRGFRLGLAGESGSGKSTLLNLLFRFYDPTHGAVMIDGLNLRDIATGDLRAQMALVSQDVVIFNQSIAENIACGRTGATRAEVEAAARAAAAHEFISALPAGYDTCVGERGLTLSGGQRARVAIARAFIRDAPILALDEATAALDSQAEAEVQDAIRRLAENRTVVCIAHRLSTLAGMDQILTLQAGRITERGTFQELLAAAGPFAAMAARQGLFAAVK